MTHTLPKLPYAMNALEPHISERTLEFHYGKHHQAYVDNLNKFVKDTDLENKTLVEVIRASAGKSDMVPIFNNAAQVWNHTFYWHSMSPDGGGMPSGKLLEMLLASFGDLAKFEEQFKQAAISQFGSGWAWLVYEDDTLKVTKTSNAETPLTGKQKPLLTCDVWEHAYYLDYQNRRPDYVGTFFGHLANWDFAAANLEDALKG